MPCFDNDGNIVATENSIVNKPWVVLESSKHPGRFYFFNTVEKKTAWTLDPALFISVSSETGTEEECKNKHKAESSDLPPISGVSSSRGTDAPSLLAAAAENSALPSLSRRQSREGREERDIFRVSSTPKRDSYEIFDSAIPLSKGHAPLWVTDGLGQGGYGVVMEVEHTKSKRRFAMKAIAKDKLRRRRDRERLTLELKIMGSLPPSPFCQQYYEAFETKTCVFIMMDVQKGGDLFFHLMERINTQGTALSEKEVRVILAELTLALEHVHKEGYIHRDLKVENVMLDSSGHVKLIDFGLAVALVDDVEQSLSPTGSLIYMAPEMIDLHRGGRHTDWWAMGVLAYELLTGSSPWAVIDDKVLLKQEIRSRTVAPPVSASPSAAEFIEMLLRKDAQHRLGTRSDAEVKEAPFFSCIDWERTAALECPPALTPPGISITDEDKGDAFGRYNEMRIAEKHPDAAPQFWMGLRVVGSFPESSRN